MAIGIAVDILGCTGSSEERVTTLNKIIQIAVELKELGDFFAFSSIMKALEMPQVRIVMGWPASIFILLGNGNDLFMFLAENPWEQIKSTVHFSQI